MLCVNKMFYRYGGNVLKKYGKLLAVTLCTAMIVTSATGCGKKKTEDKKEVTSEVKENSDCLSYVTLGDYSSIKINKNEIDVEAEKQITENIKSTGKYNKVKKGKVKKGDIINIYYVGKVNGKAFEGGSCTKKSNPAGFDLEIGSNSFIDGFEDALIGKTVGKKHDINVTFPESYQQNKDLEGKKAVFSVTINFKKVYPEISDDFVKENFKGFSADYDETAQDYTKYIRDNVIEEKAWSIVKDASKVKDIYPSDRLEDMKSYLKTSITSYLKQGGYNLEDYLKAQNTTEDEFDKQIEVTAKENVAQQLIYGAIAQKENIKVSDDDYKKGLKNYMTKYNCKDEKELKKFFKENLGTNAENKIKEDMLFSNVRKFIAKNVKES